MTDGAPMHGFAAPKIPNIRLGIVGMGSRGCGILNRASKLPGVTITAICDNVPEKVAKAQKMLADKKKPAAKEYLGDTAWQKLCDDPNVDVVYNTTPWCLHVPVALGAMRGGKHVFTEVPSAFTVDQCWELVETSEKTKRHCMQLENCCYGEIEMLTFNLAKLGMLGELVHAEGAYIHDLRWMCAREWPGVECWRFDENRDHGGNRYPTHGLVPLCLTFDVNRGDRLDYLVSLESNQANFRAFMEANLAADNKRRLSKVRMADMNSTLIKTVKGKSILIQHDVSTPRPYSRIQLVTGTKGSICDYPYRVVFEEKSGAGARAWAGTAAWISSWTRAGRTACSRGFRSTWTCTTSPRHAASASLPRSRSTAVRARTTFPTSRAARGARRPRWASWTSTWRRWASRCDNFDDCFRYLEIGRLGDSETIIKILQAS